MNLYKGIQDFEEELKKEHDKEFGDEQDLAIELFDIYLEAVEITGPQWQLQPERHATLTLINRTFNDLHAGWKLIMEGMLGQGMTLLRDTIECAHYIKLFEADPEFRNQWLEGKDFLLRDVRNRMKKRGVPFPLHDQLYKAFSQVYSHPSMMGIGTHVANWYPNAQEYGHIYRYGGVRDVPRTRSIALIALVMIYFSVHFIFQEMFLLDKNIHASWYNRFATATQRITAQKAKADQEWAKYLFEQLSTNREVIDERLKWFLES